jgi:methionyl-tRNA synthetase
MTKKVLITSALPYANGPLHFGHIAGAYLPGDCYARFQRLVKSDVLYICGSDEYGIAITLSAELLGKSPKEHVDIFHAINESLFKKLNFSFDHYSRTTWSGHVEFVHQYFIDLLHNGYIEERITDQLYSEADQKFLADRYVVGACPSCGYEAARGDECSKCGASYEATDLRNPLSKITGAPLIRKPTKHWFLLLDKFKDKLMSWLETKDWKPNVMKFAKGYIKDLRPRAITRDMTWGVSIPLPNTQEKVLYVWFDAPIGYISASKEWAQKIGNPDKWKDYWLDTETKLVQFIGKDNIPFHAALFPATTMGQNQPYKLVDELPANEFFMLEGKQFSKSEGWYIDLEDFFTRYSTDQIRYTIAANAPETSDSEFTWKDFQIRCNGELLGKYGNFVNRVLTFAHNNCQSIIFEMEDIHSQDKKFLEEVSHLVQTAYDCYDNFKLRRASQVVMELAQLGNIYFDSKQPWKEAKDPQKFDSMKTTIRCCFECIKALALISYPIIPETAQKVWRMLGFASSLEKSKWSEIATQRIPDGQKLLPAELLFRKIEDDQIEKEISALHQLSKKHEKKFPISYSPLKEKITIDQVAQLDLRVGKVLSAEPIPKSKKLLKLTVDLGFEKRTIVSGIYQQYSPDQIIGKNIVVIANLQPATIMGVESQGMLLAGSGEEMLEIISVDKLPPGSIIK